MYCTNCGNQIPDGSAFCPQCGARVTTTPVPSASTLPTAAESVVSKKRGFPLVPVMAALVAVAAIVALVVLVLPNLMGGANRPTGMSAGGDHTVALRSDGTVVAAGDNDDGQCDVSGWSDVTVAAGGYHTVGLRSDGTVVAAGLNDEGQCDVSGWDLSGASSRAASFPTDWSGTYEGYSQYAEGGSIDRTLRIVISSVTEEGDVSGICYIGANDPEAGTGSYYVEGTIDWDTRTIELHGTRWYKQEDVKYMRVYNGTVSSGFDRITGTCMFADGSRVGAWEMRSAS